MIPTPYTPVPPGPDYSPAAYRLRSLGLQMVTATCREAAQRGISPEELLEACDYYETHRDVFRDDVGCLRSYVLQGGRWPGWVSGRIRESRRKAAAKSAQQDRRYQYDAAKAEQRRWLDEYEALEQRTGPIFDRLPRKAKRHVVRYVLQTTFEQDRFRANPQDSYLRGKILTALEQDPFLREIWQEASPAALARGCTGGLTPPRSPRSASNS